MKHLSTVILFLDVSLPHTFHPLLVPSNLGIVLLFLDMATVSVALSEPEYEHAATKSNSYATEHELPPAVQIKTTNPLTESFLPTSIKIVPAEDPAFSDVEGSNTKEISAFETNYGHRLIPQLIDERAVLKPQGSVWSLPKSSNLADGFRDISYGQVARAINKVAWWIDEQIGKSTTFEKLAYIGPPDLRYSILTIAAQKTGHTVSRKVRKCRSAVHSPFPGILLFPLEQYRGAPAPSRNCKLPSLHHSGHSHTRCHFPVGQTRNANSRDIRTRRSYIWPTSRDVSLRKDLRRSPI